MNAFSSSSGIDPNLDLAQLANAIQADKQSDRGGRNSLWGDWDDDLDQTTVFNDPDGLQRVLNAMGDTDETPALALPPSTDQTLSTSTTTSHNTVNPSPSNHPPPISSVATYPLADHHQSSTTLILQPPPIPADPSTHSPATSVQPNPPSPHPQPPIIALEKPPGHKPQTAKPTDSKRKRTYQEWEELCNQQGKRYVKLRGEYEKTVKEVDLLKEKVNEKDAEMERERLVMAKMKGGYEARMRQMEKDQTELQNIAMEKLIPDGKALALEENLQVAQDKVLELQGDIEMLETRVRDEMEERKQAEQRILTLEQVRRDLEQRTAKATVKSGKRPDRGGKEVECQCNMMSCGVCAKRSIRSMLDGAGS